MAEKECGTPLTVAEARIAAARIRRARYGDPLYCPWVIEGLCDMIDELQADLAAERAARRAAEWAARPFVPEEDRHE
jgi:hypothetical protein